MSTTTEDIQRHRDHPPDRFMGPERLQNLDQLTEKMLNENLDEVHVKQGHRQFTLVREGRLTMTLFHFEEGGELTRHQVDGVTCLHVLDGQLAVETDHSQRVMTANDFFVMDPGLEHSVSAYEESRAVMTIETSND